MTGEQEGSNFVSAVSKLDALSQSVAINDVFELTGRAVGEPKGGGVILPNNNWSSFSQKLFIEALALYKNICVFVQNCRRNLLLVLTELLGHGIITIDFHHIQ